MLPCETRKVILLLYSVMVNLDSTGSDQFGALHIKNHLDKLCSPKRIDIIAIVFGNMI